MMKKTTFFILGISIFVLCFVPKVQAAGDDIYYYALGLAYYNSGQYDKALDELSKALEINPRHEKAAEYVARIHDRQMTQEEVDYEHRTVSQRAKLQEEAIDREYKKLTAMMAEDKKIEKFPDYEPMPARLYLEEYFSNAKISGEAKMGFGVNMKDGDFWWNRANYDLNERNFRILSDNRLDNRENTFDPGIYDRLRFNVDLADDGPFSVHTNITIDPWSFTSKSKSVTVAGSGGDLADIEVLYWSNTGYSVNQTFNTLQNGDSFNLPEFKASGGRILPTTVTSEFSNVFTIPEIKLEDKFQPIREFWVDYEQEEAFKLRLFPMAYQDMAYTSDDPLRLSNNHIYWEESPWLARWQPGNVNTGASPVDFTKGKWDDSLAFFTRDSDGLRLTALRGIALEMWPNEETSIAATVATPKTLWQDFGRVEAIPSSLRVKTFLSEDLYVGGITNLHIGLSDHSFDAYNYVWGLDSGFSPMEGIKLEGEISGSRSKQDITDDKYDTEKRGNAYYLALTATTLPQDDLLRTDYYGIGLSEEDVDPDFVKGRLFYARMDEGFETSLSTYRETRDDSYWSRHIHFRDPMNMFFAGGAAGISMDDINPFAIGNGIDFGRYVVGARAEGSFLSGQLHGLVDVRNVHFANHKFAENVARTEITHKTTDRWTNKLFLIRHDLPDTTGGFDPFISISDTGEPITNAAIPDGEDPSVSTVSLGSQYEFTDWVKGHVIWEYTNDFTAGADNFPRGILDDTTFSTFVENGLTFREELPFLHSQGFFDLPPYDYHNVIKTGVDVQPREDLNIYIDYTRNPNEFAGQLDDNINHLGIEITYLPTTQLGMFFKYTWSRWNDLFRLNTASTVSFESHHNVFTELRYNISETDNLVFQFGVGPSPSLNTTTFDPFGGSLLTLDTQHVVRLFYQKTF